MREFAGLVHHSSPWKICLPMAGFALWLVVFFGGLDLMSRYEFTAKAAGKVPKEWPQGSQLRRDAGQATLVFIVDSRRPSTQASLSEMASLLASSPGRWTAHILFLEPEKTGDDWRSTAVRRAVGGIPGVTILSGHAGAEARRFGGATSGDVLLYDASGRLAFHGGINEMGGMAGDNAGKPALRAMLAGN